jgi:glycogen operon protein
LHRTQHGNNNAYCQDNALNWIDWDLDADAEEVLEVTRRLLALRREHPVFRRRKFFQGRPIHGSDLADIGWFGPDGREMDHDQWLAGSLVALGMFLNGDEISEPGPRGERIVDDSFLLLFNGPDPVQFRLPNGKWANTFELLLDTAIGYAGPDAGRPNGLVEGVTLLADEELALEARSLVILRKTS